MPLYMTQFVYAPEAWAALTRNPQDRSEAVRALMESTGSRLVSFYHSFGEYDGVIVFESPDESTAAVGILTAISASHIKAIKTTPLLSVEDTMEAAPPEAGLSSVRPLFLRSEGCYSGNLAQSPTSTPRSSKKPRLTSRAYCAGSAET